MVNTVTTTRPVWLRSLSVLLFLQCLGEAGGLVAHGSQSGLWAVRQGLMNPVSAAFVDNASAWAIALLATVAVIRQGDARRGAAALLAIWFALESVVATINGLGFASELAVFAHAVRFVVPALIAWPVSEETLKTCLRCAIASVFAGHGAEALLGHPQFADFLLVVPATTVGVTVGPVAAGQLLVLIGLVDITVAIWLATRARPELLLWAAFWGILTAMVRIAYFGFEAGWHLSLLRAANGGAPLVYWWLVHGRGQFELRRINHAQ